MTTNMTVAVIIDELFERVRSFAIPRHATHSTKPTAMIIAVRIATCRRLLLVGEMVAETYATAQRVVVDLVDQVRESLDIVSFKI
jgi:hypothetical protein